MRTRSHTESNATHQTLILTNSSIWNLLRRKISGVCLSIAPLKVNHDRRIHHSPWQEFLALTDRCFKGVDIVLLKVSYSKETSCAVVVCYEDKTIP